MRHQSRIEGDILSCREKSKEIPTKRWELNQRQAAGALKKSADKFPLPEIEFLVVDVSFKNERLPEFLFERQPHGARTTHIYMMIREIAARVSADRLHS